MTLSRTAPSVRSEPLLPRPDGVVPSGRTPGAEGGHSAVVLVADDAADLDPPAVSTQLLPISRVWLAVGDDVEDADAGDAAPLVGDELVAEQLVAATDGQHDDAVVSHRPQLRAAGDEVRADVALRGILAAAAEQDVGVPGQRVADADRHHGHRQAAPLQPRRSTSTLPVSP